MKRHNIVKKDTSGKTRKCKYKKPELIASYSENELFSGPVEGEARHSGVVGPRMIAISIRRPLVMPEY